MKLKRVALIAFFLTLLSPLTAESSVESKALCEQLVFKAYDQEVAGFQKVDVAAYQENCSDYSLAYNYDDGKIKIAGTFYNYEYADLPGLKEHFNEVKTAITTVSKDADLVDEGKLTITNGGEQFEALRAGFELEGKFGEKMQDLYSEVILLKNKNAYLKLRITTPVDNKELAQKKAVEFLSKIDWPR